MTEASKRKFEYEQATDACRNWKTCELSELRKACGVVEGAIFYLIHRMAH